MILCPVEGINLPRRSSVLILTKHVAVPSVQANNSLQAMSLSMIRWTLEHSGRMALKMVVASLSFPEVRL